MKTKNGIEKETVATIPQIAPMSLHPDTGVTLSYQNFGSALLLILRGSTEQIELTYNSLYNWAATGGSLTFTEQTQTIATIWTSEKNLRRYFLNRFESDHQDKSDLIKVDLANLNKKEGDEKKMGCVEACAYVESRLEELYLHHEIFLDFTRPEYVPATYSIGKISAERPDESFKDKVLIYAHKDKSADVVAKEVSE